jgi:hypothetical protein
MKRLVMCLAVIAGLSTSAFSYDAHRGTQGQREADTTPRPPSAIPRLTDSHSNVAVSTVNGRDNRVLEFLRWKEQLRTGNTGSR